MPASESQSEPEPETSVVAEPEDNSAAVEKAESVEKADSAPAEKPDSVPAEKSVPDIKISPPVKHHYFRTIFSSFFGFIALMLIIVSILVLWLNKTLTNTDQYVHTVAPLIRNPDVQSFVIHKATDSLLENKDTPVRDIASQLLAESQINGKTDDQLRTELEPILLENLDLVVETDEFADFWEKSNRDIHGQLMTQLNSESSVIKLNFHPVLVAAIDQMAHTKLSFIKEKMEIRPDMGIVTIQGDQLEKVRTIYGYFQQGMMAVIALAVLFTVLCVVISVHHTKTLRRIAIATGISSAVLASILSASSLLVKTGNDIEQQKMAIALVNGLTKDLRLTLIIIAVVCIVGAIVSKIVQIILFRRAVQKTQLKTLRD